MKDNKRDGRLRIEAYGWDAEAVRRLEAECKKPPRIEFPRRDARVRAALRDIIEGAQATACSCRVCQRTRAAVDLLLTLLH